MRVGVEIDEADVDRKVFEIERDADAEARERSPKGKEFHGPTLVSYLSPQAGRGEEGETPYPIHRFALGLQRIGRLICPTGFQRYRCSVLFSKIFRFAVW
jgi:hypothetical protein